LGLQVSFHPDYFITAYTLIETFEKSNLIKIGIKY